MEDAYVSLVGIRYFDHRFYDVCLPRMRSVLEQDREFLADNPDVWLPPHTLWLTLISDARLVRERTSVKRALDDSLEAMEEVSVFKRALTRGFQTYLDRVNKEVQKRKTARAKALLLTLAAQGLPDDVVRGIVTMDAQAHWARTWRSLVDTTAFEVKVPNEQECAVRTRGHNIRMGRLGSHY